MLVLSRTREESISIGDDIVIKVLEIVGSKVRLGITAPRDVRVLRSELIVNLPRPDQVQESKAATAQVTQEIIP